MSNQQGYQTDQNIFSDSTPFNALQFVVKNMLSQIATVTIVQVVSVTNTGDDVAVGYVNIQPLINQTDGMGNPIPNAVIYNCPYFRMQGGTNAIILDPQVGDIGIAVFCDKDYSKVVANASKATAGTAGTPGNPVLQNPDSARRFSMSDGLYFGGILNGVPTQFVEFSTAGININSPTLIQLNANDIKLIAPTIEMNATSSVTMTTPTFTLNGSMTATGTVTAPTIAGTTDVTFAGKSALNHKHSGVTPGAGQTGIPV